MLERQSGSLEKMLKSLHTMFLFPATRPRTPYACGCRNFDLAAFNADKAASLRNNAQRVHETMYCYFLKDEEAQIVFSFISFEQICHVLYPGDATVEGKLLRLKQQFTLCSASIQDMIARFKERSGSKVNFRDFPLKVAIQMNDTHPTLCIPELMRILMDCEGLAWDQAWDITRATVAYTNHTVLPEALEKWPLPILRKLLPRHVEIIERIDETFIKFLARKVNQDELGEAVARMRVLENVEFPESLRKTLISDKKSKPESPTHTKEKTEAKICRLGKENIDIKAEIKDRDEFRKAAIAKEDPVKPVMLLPICKRSALCSSSQTWPPS